MNNGIMGKTDDMRSVSTQLKGKSEELDQLIKQLYNIVDNACSQSWIGVDSKEFAKTVNDFRPYLESASKDIMSFSELITTSASNMDETAAEIQGYMKG